MKNTGINGRSGFTRFLILWSGELFSSLGTGLTAFALTASAYRQSGQAADSALVLLLSFLPSFLIRPFAGVLADRLDRRFLMMIGNMGSAMGILLVLPFIRGDGVDLHAAAPGLILSSLCAGILSPAYKASVSDFLPPELYEKAGGLVQLSSAAPLLLSPMTAGILMMHIDVSAILLLDAISFLVSALIIDLVRRGMAPTAEREGGEENTMQGANSTAPAADRDLKEDLLEGWTVIRSRRGVLILTVLVGFLLFFVSLLQALLTPLILSFSTITRLGMVQTLCACGILVGSLILSTLGGSLLRVRSLSLCLGAMGLFFAFIGIRENLILIIIPGLLFFMTLPFVNTGIEVLIRRNIENDKQGRAWSLISFITCFGAISAFGCAGFLADRIFNPLMMDRGALVPLLGRIFGSGQGRGIALLFFISGTSVIFLSVLLSRSESIRALEESC